MRRITTRRILVRPLPFPLQFSSRWRGVTDRGIGDSHNVDSTWLTLTPHLATHPGPPSQKAYALLRLHLSSYDSSATSVYHFVVLRRILEMNRRATLPEWLVEELIRRDASGLGRVLWEFGRLMELFEVCETLLMVRFSSIHLISFSNSTELY